MPRQSPAAKLKNPTCKRSAPFGNPNALIHGFYARAYRAGELADLDAMLTEGLQDEITMLRIATRRVIEFIDEFQEPKEATATLGALGLAAVRLSTLLRTQKLLTSGEHNTAAALTQALVEVEKELGIHA
jgi:hypothetical protein